MSEKKAYEQIISSKLEALPLPDMADAIWGRIEAQLDIDLPTDGDGGGGPSPVPTPSGWMGGAGLLVFIAALISIFFITKNNQKETPLITPIQNVQKPVPAAPVENLQREREANRQRPRVQRETDNKEEASASPPQTSVDELPVDANSPLVADSSAATVIAPPPKQTDTLPPVKRQRGVKGVTDNDYRIVPK